MTGRLHSKALIAATAGVVVVLSAVAVVGSHGIAHATTTQPLRHRTLGAADGGANDGLGDYVPGEVVVAYRAGRSASVAAARAERLGARIVAGASPSTGVQVLHVPSDESVEQAASRLRTLSGVAYAVPNYIAHMAGSFIPDDPGTAHVRGGWEELQWNFLTGAGVDAPGAWANLIADGRPGGRGVIVAVLDTGVAYRNWRQFRRSPDFDRTRFVDPYDFVAHNRFPLDREGHGTFVAGEIAEATNNDFGLTGLAYGARIMPVRVLAADGTGDATTISRGIRYAVKHGARVINLSLEFGIGIGPTDIPDIISAIRFAERRGVIVVGAAGNDEAPQIAYPARAQGVIAVGATTKDRCLAWYSNVGRGLALVAPGGDDDAALPSDSDCHPNRNLPSIYQMTFIEGSNPKRFGYPAGIYGTSMSSAEVAGTAALVIASGVLGSRPSPAAVVKRLEQTATPLGTAKRPNYNYGWGLLNAAAATAPVARKVK